ncbi:MAG: pyruvate formate lyase family protein [Nitrospiria bacterium]
MNERHYSLGGIHINFDKQTETPLPKGRGLSTFPIPNENFKRVKTLSDLSLSNITLDQFPVVKAWRERLFSPEGRPEICDELPRLLTDFMRRPETEKLSSCTRRAKALHYVFSNKTALVKDNDLLPGQTTTSFVGPVVYVDTIGYCIWPELKSVSRRAQNPFNIRPEVAERLNKEIFPFWLERRPVQEAARYGDYDTQDYENDGRDAVDGGRLADGTPSIDPPLKKKAGETPKCHALMERVAFYLSDKATCVSHTVPDFERLLAYGLDALSARIRHDIAHLPSEKSREIEFLNGVLTVFEGAKIYASHLATAAERARNADLAAICRKVPAKPADTLHEALCSIWICYHLLLQENTNFGLSIGRLDQLLNRFYLSDWEKLSRDEEKEAYTARAVELVGHFFLRCSDHVPLSTEGSEILFAGSGSNQALTVGGTKYENGQVKDAVNDMTYIILKATELLSIRDPNVHARYHKAVHHRNAAGEPLREGEYDPYLKRISQVNILTRATPALHGDVPVVHAMSQYYAAHAGVGEEEALADAYDYASIGCIEQNAAGKHYGNTGSTLFVLPAVLELALYGGKHRSGGVGKDALNLLYDETAYTTKPLTQMKNMGEFIAAFRFQLDEMARHAVQCNNYLGRAMETVRPSPFLSGLFTGPTNTPDSKDAKFRDVAAGGARYNSAGVAIIGLADIIDSFCVIEQLVFRGKIKAAELLAALEANFSPDGASRDVPQPFWIRLIRFLKALFSRGTGVDALPKLSPERLRDITEKIRLAPKYGAGVDQTPGGTYDNSAAVRYTHLITEMIQEVFYKYRTHRGGRYLPGYWSMTNHAGFGMLSQATPNGRKARMPFASGITPCPGIVKRNGEPVVILDHILSVAEVDGDTVRNGYTYNLSLTARDAAHFPDDTELFSKYMKTFLDHDGVLVQLCVSSIKDLSEAHVAATAAARNGGGEDEAAALAPYQDLMIRVAGYSAYFVSLSPQMRQEIIDRANFALDSGVEQHTLAAI